MRPLRLAMKGFTSFRDEQELDFSDLDLFALVGPTGSGKSSVLDAMTYALYGEVDRLRGTETSMKQLISQGQPRMAVTLDFEVGLDRYRVTRSLPAATGPTKILLQRWDGSEWVQSGEGADRVREANRMLQDLIGLDFDGFTRSVLLPQGKFSAFMAGDAAQRRDILTDLLGLSLFERMGKGARQIAKKAKDRAEWTEDSIGSQYGHATGEALEGARALAKESARRQGALATAAARVRDISKRWEAVAREAEQLDTSAAEVVSLAAAASGHAETLKDLADESSGADQKLAAAKSKAKSATQEALRSEKSRSRAEREWGTIPDLVRGQAEAARLEELRNEVDDRGRAVSSAKEAVPAAVRAVEDAQALVAAAGEAVVERTGEREAAVSRLEEVRHADAVVSLLGSLRRGDPCPVCGEPLASLPKTPGARVLRDARRADEAARKAEVEASARSSRAERELDRARDGATSAKREVAAAEKELRRSATQMKKLEAEIGSLLGDLPKHPAAALADRLSRLEDLARDEQQATKEAGEAEEALAEARGLREKIASDAAAARAGLLALAVAGVIERAGRLDAGVTGPSAGDFPPATDLGALSATAHTRADSLHDYGDRLAKAAAERASAEPSYLREAEYVVGDLVPQLPTLKALADAVTEAELASIRHQEQNEAEARRIEMDLAKVAELRREAAKLRTRATTFHSLARELQADRLIAFLQAEALRLLAVGASRRLSSLSTGRYELTYQGDEFLVVDRWNGGDTRSVRTLSGGETFLASLALALALAEQVTSLAVTERASLDSLFLDEGFGTLDPESLEVVVEAIEQLGGDGRMVGVITHVRDLAERLPARLEVAKSPRGSSVRLAV